MRMVKLQNHAEFLAEHYLYEITMLRMTFKAIPRETDIWRRNALMESFAIHARVLMDFFISKPKNDDIVARHFIAPNINWNNEPSGMGVDMRNRINKQVSHLTASREGARKIDEVDRVQILSALEAAHSRFKASVRTEYMTCFAHEVG